MKEIEGELALELTTPNVRRDAWEGAVANQAVTWMPPTLQEKYSTLYTHQRDYQSSWERSPTWILNGAKLIDLYSDLEVAQADPKETYHIAKQMLAVTKESGGTIRELQKLLQTALPGADGAGKR
jgi:hypothetical protein